MAEVINETPSNLNMLSNFGGKFILQRAPTLDFFTQKVSLPGMTLTNTNMPNPFVRIPIPGDHIEWNNLIVTFKVDEDLKNYLEIWNWMINLGFPENQAQYASLVGNLKAGIKSDATLVILSDEKNPRFEVNFWDIFPIQMTDLEFNTTDGTLNYMTVTVHFKFTLFEINPIN